MGDAENALPPSKKRAAGREISKDNPGLDDDEDSSEQEVGTFKRASDEVLASRRIVKVRRNQTASTPSSNPFAGIRLMPPTEPAAAPTEVSKTEEVATNEKVSDDGKKGASDEMEKDKNDNGKQSGSETDEPVAETATDKGRAEDQENNDMVNQATEPKVESKKQADDESQKEKAAEGDNVESEDKKDNGNENVDRSAEGTPLSSFQQLSSSQNAFTGLAGTGFSASTFTFGSVSKDGSTLGASSGSLFGNKNEQPSFGFGLCNNGSSSLFNTTGSSIDTKSEGSVFPSMQEVPVETGEENERVVFTADSVLFEFFDGGWKERGKGELKVNVSAAGSERARLLMRARGNYRLILNANLYPDMKLTNMDKRGVTFVCMNCIGEGKDGLSTFALKFKDASLVEEFRAAITVHKGKAATVLKTPENSPKAPEE